MKHQHLLVRGRGRAKLEPQEAADLLRKIITAVGMRVASVTGNPLIYDCTVPGNEGVTVVFIIETSHCEIRSQREPGGTKLHTWTHEAHDLTLYQFDLYSCAHFDPLKVCQILKDRLDFVSFERMLIDRTIGLQNV